MVQNANINLRADEAEAHMRDFHFGNDFNISQACASPPSQLLVSNWRAFAVSGFGLDARIHARASVGRFMAE